jgi:hypothetical protein
MRFHHNVLLQGLLANCLFLFVEQLRAWEKARAHQACLFFMGGGICCAPNGYFILEQTVQATHQAVHEKCLHDILGSAFSHSDQTSVTFSEGII